MTAGGATWVATVALLVGQPGRRAGTGAGDARDRVAVGGIVTIAAGTADDQWLRHAFGSLAQARRINFAVKPLARSMIKSILGALVALLVVVPAAHAQGRPSQPQLVGLPVFAADGIKVGRVSDLSMSDGRIDQIQVSTGSALGFGERTIAVPQPAFMSKGDMVLIPDLSAEDIEALPSDPSVSPSLVIAHPSATL